LTLRTDAHVTISDDPSQTWAVIADIKSMPPEVVPKSAVRAGKSFEITMLDNVQT